MRVAADQLLAHVVGHPGQVALAALLEQQRQEVDLEEDVAELVEELGVVARVGRVGQLVGLLDRVRDNRALVLVAVPRTVAAQPARDLVKPRQRGREIPVRAHYFSGVGVCGSGCGCCGCWLLGCCGCCGWFDWLAPLSASLGAFLHSATR